MTQTTSINTKPSLVFKVHRQVPELIAPARPTLYEFKELSDIDDQDGLRFQISVIFFYSYDDKHFGAGSSTLRRDDPAKVIKDAIAKALVSYPPFAGRLRQRKGRKLVVECNGQGILFIEAHADVTLKEFGDELQPPFPCFEELLYNVPGSSDILDTPLILIQVTRLKCGGFILAVRYNHTMADGQGLAQFLNAVAKLARGANSLSNYPVWERQVFSARDPPQVTSEHHAYDEVADTKATIIPLDDMVHKSFFFGATEIAALRRFIPPKVKSSTFEILTACLWRCRTIALQPDNPDDDIYRIVCVVSARFAFDAYVPKGYYGNSFAFSASLSTARELCSNSIGYALDLVKKAKSQVTREHMKSLTDLMVLKGRPHFTAARTFGVSDLTRVGFDNLDLGWGPPAYGGIARGGVGAVPGALSFYNSYKNGEGEQGIVVPICLPDENAMALFVKELNGLLSDVPTHPIANNVISSSL